MKLWTKIQYFVLAFLPSFALAQGSPNAVDISTPQKLVALINRVGDYMYMILLALGVIFLVYAGYVFLIGRGDEKEAERAKKIILYSVVAIAVAILARGIVALTQNVLGPGESSSNYNPYTNQRY